MKNLTLEEYLTLCAPEANPKDVRQITEQTTAYYKTGDAALKTTLASDLERAWYASLSAGSPDYGIYDHQYYLAELWACWMIYSRKYIAALDKPVINGASIKEDLGLVHSVVDLGCGTGLTTRALRAEFPVAAVCGTNVEGTPQMRIARTLGEDNNFSVAGDLLELRDDADLVFASEYFEHHQAPVAHLREVLDATSPRALIIANSFGSRAIGHFLEYDVDGKMVNGAAASRAFGAELRKRGYKKIETSLWNGRPAYWKKD